MYHNDLQNKTEKMWAIIKNIYTYYIQKETTEIAAQIKFS